MYRLGVLVVASLGVFGCSPPAQPTVETHQADLIVVGGSIVTLDLEKPRVEALASLNGRIVALGSRSEIEALQGSGTEVLDLAGGIATPGLIDAHAHLAGLGRQLQTMDLRGARTPEEVVERLRASAPTEGWILGRGWDQNLWPEPTMPTHTILTAAFPDRPVWLRRVDGHAGWANAETMRLSKIDPSTKNPIGGEILRGEDGEATGVLVDTAMDLVPVPDATRAEVRSAVLAGQEHALSRGLTSIHDMGVSALNDEVYRELDAEHALTIRVVGYADESWFRSDLRARTPEPLVSGAHYQLVGVKVYADGALGSRGAALIDDYTDRPGHRGATQQSPSELEALVTDAVRQGWQVATHSIGDAGNRLVLDAYEAALRRYRGRDHRLRVEHAQILSRAELPRFAQLGVIASMQPTHATSDMPWAEQRLGPLRLAGAYAWRSLLGTGARVAFGSDAPVELIDPLHGLHAAITRQDASGSPEGGWLPDQRVSLDEALAATTRDAAYAGRQEQDLGLLRVGAWADLTCIGEDLWTIDPSRVRNATIEATVIAGKIVYRGSPH